MNYYSPELVRYIQGTGNAAEVTAASDIFAVGLIYAEYLTGTQPAFEPSHRSAAVAALNGATLQLRPGDTPAFLVQLVERMLLAEPSERPTVSDVHATLMGTGRSTTTARRVPKAPPVGSVAAASAPNPLSPITSRLRGKGLTIASGIRRSAHPAGTGDEGRAVVGLLGRLLGRPDDRSAR